VKVTGEGRYSSLIIFRLGALGALDFGSPSGMSNRYFDFHDTCHNKEELIALWLGLCVLTLKYA
jgi:hypothetical protein